MLPRAIGDGTVDPGGHETFSVLSANIHRGTADPEALVALVDRYDVDLLSVQELTPSFARSSDTGPGSTGACRKRSLETHQGAAGGGLYSRLPLQPAAHPLAELLPHAARRGRACPTAAASASSTSTR